MAEQRAEVPFQVDGLSVVEDGGVNKLVLGAEEMAFSIFDVKNESGIRVVLPDGRTKIFEGIHEFVDNTKRLEVGTWIGDLKI
jgi:hypothetical protein